MAFFRAVKIDFRVFEFLGRDKVLKQIQYRAIASDWPVVKTRWVA